MGRGHRHTWRPHPPGGRWRQSWDEVYWDEEEMANNLNTNSQDKMEDLKFFLSRDPNFRNSEDWPELVEWCSCCPAVRKVKFVMKDTEVTNEEKVDEEVKVIAEKVEVEEMIVVKVREEEPVVNVEEVKVVEEKLVRVKCEDVKEEKDETLKLKEPDVKSSREVCTQTHLAASSNNTQMAILERVDDGGNEGGKEVGCQTEGSKRKRRGGGRGSRMRRLLNYQHFLTEQRGLPLSRLLSLSMKKTEARFTRQRKKREEEVSASPQLRRSVVREEEGGEASSPSSSLPDPLQPLPPAFPYPTLPPPFYPSYTPSYIPPYAPPYTHTYTPPSSPPYSPPHTLPCAPPYSLPNTPPYTLPNTPPYTPLCGPIPGPQWLFCGPVGPSSH